MSWVWTSSILLFSKTRAPSSTEIAGNKSSSVSQCNYTAHLHGQTKPLSPVSRNIK